MPFPPGARNEKAPARSLSGRTSAMIEFCVKGGRVVNASFFFLTMLYAKAWRELDVTTTLSSVRSRPTIGIQEMPDLTIFGVEMGGDCVKTQNPRVWRELFPPSGALGKVEQNFLTLIRHQENSVPSLWPPDRVFTQSRLKAVVRCWIDGRLLRGRIRTTICSRWIVESDPSLAGATLSTLVESAYHSTRRPARHRLHHISALACAAAPYP